MKKLPVAGSALRKDFSNYSDMDLLVKSRERVEIGLGGLSGQRRELLPEQPSFLGHKKKDK
jgi:predicted nucleotidyltransferase